MSNDSRLEPRERLLHTANDHRLEAEELELGLKALATDFEVIDDEYPPATAQGVRLAVLARGRSRQGDPEARSSPRLARDAHITAHGVGEALHDGEPEARAAVMTRSGGIDLREALEQPVQPIGGNADAGV